MTTSSFVTSNVQLNASVFCVVSNSYGATTSAVVSLTAVPDPTLPFPAAVFNDNPIGYWPLSEGPDNHGGNNGTTTHDYISGNNGFYSNVNLGLSGYGVGLATEYGYSPATDTNSAAQFGVFTYPDTYVAQIPNINFGTSGTASSFSVEAWANGFSLGSGTAVVNKGWGSGGEQFTMDYTTGWRFYVRNAAGTTSTALSTNTTDGNWHHLVGVVDTVHSNVLIYVDGVARASAAFNPSGGLLMTTNEVVIGSRMSGQSTAFNDDFNGTIQNVAIYNYALSASQVANHYYAAGIGPSVTTTNQITVNDGTTLIIAAGVTGSPVLSYQWDDTTYGTPGTALLGQTNATLIISNITAAAYNGHTVDLTVSNIYGQATSGSTLIIVEAGAPNSITITPPSLSVYEGLAFPVAFTVTAQGSAPFVYQWTTNGGNVLDATNAYFTNSSLLPSTYTLACIVANSAGTNSSPTATLAIVVAPAGMLTAPPLSTPGRWRSGGWMKRRMPPRPLTTSGTITPRMKAPSTASQDSILQFLLKPRPYSAPMESRPASRRKTTTPPTEFP